ncbi:hypothetical protein P7F60_06115 [Rhizobium sp. YJ-22]|uniref:hypothetical protein n=1 Tax=Rhizobium sp. YJ-22 TaxID=3037556 RepID=UPI002412CF58|nr:hypothetical protein [Rhizobium sp. YJ-22]MDG3575951.1 hypothetical protein [Rhizobium sp. YJ-22]
MLRLVSSCCLAALVTAGTFVPFVTPTHAQDMELQIGPDGVRPVIRDRREEERRRRLREQEREDFRAGCDPDQAVEEARDAGLRRARVVRMNERRIVVEGRTDDGIERMTFANRPGCPEL